MHPSPLVTDVLSDRKMQTQVQGVTHLTKDQGDWIRECGNRDCDGGASDLGNQAGDGAEMWEVGMVDGGDVLRVGGERTGCCGRQQG